MTTIVTRQGKGFPLTDLELDTNFTNLNAYKLDDAFVPTRANTAPSLSLDFTQRTLDPRITFSRASTATYYDGQTVALAEQNLLTYSQSIGGTNWILSSLIANVNTAIAPDGTSTASTFTVSAANLSHYIYQLNTSIPANTIATLSLYLKMNTWGYWSIVLQGGAGAIWIELTVDLNSGTISKVGNGTGGTYISSTISLASNGYYRISLTGSLSAICNAINIIPNSNATPIYGAYGQEIWSASGTESAYVWGAQLEQRSSVSVYIPTTTQAISNYNPVLQTASANTARFDTNPVTKESLGLFIEEQRTNLLTYSSNFDNSIWGKSSVNIYANTNISPEGSLTACTMTENGSNGHCVYLGYSAVSGVTYTISAYYKNIDRRYAAINSSNYNNFGATYDLVSGTCATTGTGIPTITFVGNGWYRCTLTFTASTTVGSLAQIGVNSSNNGAGIQNYVTAGVSVYIWGAQLEAGAFATSYIPTPLTYSGRASTATYTGSNGLIQTAASNAARYQLNTVGGSQLLLENASSNLLTYSNKFSLSPWVVSQAILYPNVITAPDGTFTGSMLADISTNNRHRVAYNSATPINDGLTYSRSVYVKQGTARYIAINLYNGDSQGALTAIIFDFVTATISSAIATTTSVLSVGNGWYRIGFAAVNNSTLYANFSIAFATSATTQDAYIGTGCTFYIWGAQVELGSSVTSYIPSTESFTSRSTTATYYDSGTTALAEQNLLLQSQVFNAANWVTSNSPTITVGGIAAPDASTSASTMAAPIGTVASSWIQLGTSVSSTISVMTASVYLKANTHNVIGIQSGDGVNLQKTFGIVCDLNAGTITQTANGTSASITSSSITSMGNGWYRATISGTVTSPSNISIALVMLNNTTGNIWGNYGWYGNNVTFASAVNFYLWGAQLEQRSSATAYTPTTTSAISNYIPVMLTAPINSARYDFDAVTRLYKGITLEAAATNLAQYSDQFDTGSWQKIEGTILVNNCIAPDGTLSADTFIESTSINVGHRIGKNSTTTVSGTIYTASIYVKAAGRTQVMLDNYNGTSDITTTYDLTSGTVLAGTGSIISVGNGWYRLIQTFTATTSVTNNYAFSIYTCIGLINSYTGNGWSGITLWGAQLETGSVATSYIPTTTAQVTRAADISTSVANSRLADVYSSSQVTRAADFASITGTNFSSWYRGDEGTFSATATYTYNLDNTRILAASDGTTNNLIQFPSNTSYSPYMEVYSYGVSVAALLDNTSLIGSTVNVAGAYKLNDFAMSKNGRATITDTSGAVPFGINQLNIGNRSGASFLNGTIKHINYYPKRLSNAELVGLTS